MQHEERSTELRQAHVPARRKKARKSRRWNVVRAAWALLAVSLITGLGLRLIDGLQPPDIAIPEPEYVRQNAFNTLSGAGSALLDRSEIEFAVKDSKVSEPTNAYDRDYSLADKERLLRENEPSLTLIRRALGQVYVSPPIRSFDTTLPYLSDFRSLACLLVLESKVRAAHGDMAGALDSALGCIELGEKIRHGSMTIGWSAGIACDGIGRSQAWKILSSVDASTARGASYRLAEIDRQQVPFWTVLEEDKWYGQASLMKALEDSSTVSEVLFRAGSDMSFERNWFLDPIVASLFHMVYTKRDTMAEYSRQMDAQIAQAHEPFEQNEPAEWETGNPILRVMYRPSKSMRIHYDCAMAQDRLLETSIALRAYRLVNHAYPASLDDLTPQYLREVPADPFTGSQPLRYRKTKDSYGLYSVGPDGRDDGGKPIDTGPAPGATIDSRHRVSQNAKGDIVAGVNLR